MSHLHIPDGILPVWLWVAGWAITLAMVTLAGRAAARSEARRKVPLVGVVSALMIVGMSSEIVPIAYHLNLSVIGGILLGPALAIIAAFIVEIVLAMLGHGGVTVLGLNTMVIGAEMVLGWAVFHTILRALGRPRAALSAGLATVLTLAITTTLVVGIVWIGGSGEATERETGALDPGTLRFENPLAEGLFAFGLFGHDHDHDHDHDYGDEHHDGDDSHEDDEHHDEDEHHEEDEHGHEEDEHHDEDEHGHDHGDDERYLSVGRFALVVYTLGPIGWTIEALVTAGIIGYVARVRPTMVYHGALAEDRRHIPGDESGGH